MESSIQKISNLTGFKPEEIQIIKATVAKGATDLELGYFLNVAKSVELNPFNKEIWFYKDNKFNVIVVAGRDGFLTIAQRDKRWNGMTSAVVYENDEFSTDIDTGQIKINHKIKGFVRGNILGAYAITKPRGCEFATVEIVDFNIYKKEYYKDGKLIKSFWQNYPEDMIKKVAETKVLKKAFGISGLQSEYEFEIKNNIAIPLQEEKEKPEIDKLKEQIIEKLDRYQGEDKKDIQLMCQEKNDAGEFTIEFANEIIKKLS